jgi:hypothetical protein
MQYSNSPIADQRQVFAKVWPHFYRYIYVSPLIADHAVVQYQYVETT